MAILHRNYGDTCFCELGAWVLYARGIWNVSVNVRHIYFMAPKVGALRRGEMTSNSVLLRGQQRSYKIKENVQWHLNRHEYRHASLTHKYQNTPTLRPRTNPYLYPLCSSIQQGACQFMCCATRGHHIINNGNTATQRLHNIKRTTDIVQPLLTR